MKHIKIVLLIVILIVGCTSQRSRLAEDGKLIRENEQRLASLEESVSALNTQIAQLNNRVYEVRTKSGQKTSMTVVPIIRTPAPAAAPEPVAATATPAAEAPLTITPPPASQPAQKEPVGRRIDPAKKPGPMPARTAATPNKPQAAPEARAATGSVGRATVASQPEQPSGDLSLPPAELPPADVPVPQGNVNPQLPPLEESPAIPVPALPVSDLSLPPEQPGQAAAPATPPAPPKPAARPVAKSAAQGEQAAYNTALNAARSGRTSEGIRLFRDFLQKYPNGPYAANAEYWIGECLYSQGKYKDALSEFQTVNSSYPSHHKNADALLKAGITMSKMGDKEGAAEKFRTLIANFPNSEAAKRARAMGAH